MKHCWLVASAALAFVLAGCGDDKRAPASDGSVDARAADAIPSVDSAPDRENPMPDGATLGAVDGGAIDGGAAEVVGIDTAGMDSAGKDTSSPDVGAPDLAVPDGGQDAQDATTDAGVVTCGAATPRAMLCVTYCDGIARFCTGANAQYRDVDACKAACNGPTWACGMPGQLTGNSLFCRLGHVALAGVGAPATACSNAGPSSPSCQ